MEAPHSKLELRGERVEVSAEQAIATLTGIFDGLGCTPATSRAVAEHLTDASLCGVESHGVMRALQYADQMRSGYMRAFAEPKIASMATGAPMIDGGGGIGIPGMTLAYDHALSLASDTGLSALAVRNVGHTGRHGAFADRAAERGYLTLCLGGGNRETWRQVAPHGGAKAMLPTNPWCIGIPGGDNGPVVLDFATSKIAGGWIYAAQSAGALLPEGCVIDRIGNPTRDPDAYFDGGAILPSGGHKGYALALIGELLAEAMLGPATVEANWLVIAIDTSRYGTSHAFRAKAEEILEEMRTCPPAPGFGKVEIPGEREREHRDRSNGRIAVPERTWTEILTLAAQRGAN